MTSRKSKRWAWLLPFHAPEFPMMAMLLQAQEYVLLLLKLLPLVSVTTWKLQLSFYSERNFSDLRAFDRISRMQRGFKLQYLPLPRMENTDLHDYRWCFVWKKKKKKGYSSKWVLLTLFLTGGRNLSSSHSFHAESYRAVYIWMIKKFSPQKPHKLLLSLITKQCLHIYVNLNFASLSFFCEMEIHCWYLLLNLSPVYWLDGKDFEAYRVSAVVSRVSASDFFCNNSLVQLKSISNELHCSVYLFYKPFLFLKKTQETHEQKNWDDL